MTSRLRSPGPRVRRHHVQLPQVLGRKHFPLSLKPVARNSLELIRIVTGDRDVSTLRHVTGPFPVSPVPVLTGEVVHRYRL